MTDRPVLEAVGEVPTPGWLQIAPGGRHEVWINVSNIEAVIFDGYGTDIVMIGGKRHETFGSRESVLRRIEACRAPTPIVNAGEDTA